MSDVDDLLQTVLNEMRTVLDRVDSAAVGRVADRVGAATRIFVAGEGRSGFMVKAFAMRLVHLGLRVHVIARRRRVDNSAAAAAHANTE